MQFPYHKFVVVAAAMAIICTEVSGNAVAKTIEAGDAMTSWMATGQVQETEDGLMIFSGVAKGMMFVKHHEGSVRGPVHAARINCPIRSAINKSKNERQDSGICTITAHEGKDVAYAQFKCSGTVDECKGEFTFTGGSGGLAGISGSTPVFARIDIDRKESGEMFGYAFWPKLTYSLP